MRENRSVEDMEDVTTADLMAYRQSLQHLAGRMSGGEGRSAVPKGVRCILNA